MSILSPVPENLPLTSQQPFDIVCQAKNPSLICSNTLYLVRYCDIHVNKSRNNGLFICDWCAGPGAFQEKKEESKNVIGSWSFDPIDRDILAFVLGGEMGSIVDYEYLQKKYDRKLANIPDSMTHKIDFIPKAVNEFLKTKRQISPYLPLELLSNGNERLVCAFIRGYLRASLVNGLKGVVNTPNSFNQNVVQVKITSINRTFLESLMEYFNISGSIGTINVDRTMDSEESEDENEFTYDQEYLYELTFLGTNAFDFLDRVYKDSNPLTRNEEDYINYRKWCSPTINTQDVPTIWFAKSEELKDVAVIPTKAHATDVGYDLVIVKKVKDLTSTTALYDTGIVAMVSHGWRLAIKPRSSISKSGYTLANCEGVVDCNYSGTLLVALTKTDPNAPDLVLPAKLVQLEIQRWYYADTVVVDRSLLMNSTTRGEGGFGSTNSSTSGTNVNALKRKFEQNPETKEKEKMNKV